MKKHAVSFRILLCVATLCAAFATAETISICASCSWELTTGAKFCSHCGAEASGAKTTTAAQKAAADAIAVAEENAKTKEPPVPKTASEISSDAILQDSAWAKEFREKGDKSAALAALINARSITSITPASAIKEDDRRFVFDGIESLRQDLTQSTPVQCTVCGGTGRQDIAVNTHTLAGSTAGINSVKETCKFCDGSGKIYRYQVSSIKILVAAGTREYERVAQIAGRKKFLRSEIFLPENLAIVLNANQSNLLNRVTSAACAACGGFGLEACVKCDGTGIVKCTEKTCVNGIIKDTAATTTTAGGVKSQTMDSLKLINSKRCPTCQGGSYIRCPTCVGKSVQTCKRCVK